MKITVNGTPQSLEETSSLIDLLRATGMPTEGIAVALNMEVVPKTAWPNTRMKDGDVIEIVHMVGGGSGLPPSL